MGRKDAIEGRAQRLRHEFQPIEDTNRGEHMRGVSALLRAGLEPSERTTLLEQFVQ